MSLYSQTISNNPLSLDGLISGNFDLLYVDGQQVTPTDTSGLVPYTGATATVNLNSQQITTTYVPTNDEDLTNKLYVNNTFLAKAGFNVSSGNFIFNTGSTVQLNGSTYVNCSVASFVGVLCLDSANKVVLKSTSVIGDASLGATQTFIGYNVFSLPLATNEINNTGNIYTTGLLRCATLEITGSSIATPTYTLGINGSNQVVRFAGGTGDAILSAGTSGVPQNFSGYNYFANLLKLNGSIQFTNPVTAGTATYILGVDSSTGNLVSTSPTTAPTQLSITNTSVSNTYYPTWITSTSTGIKTIYGVNGVSYDLPSTILTTTKLKLGMPLPTGTTSSLLAVDSTGNVIAGATAGDAYLANTQTFTGVNTFSNQMTLTKGFDLTLGSINNFVVRNSSSVTQFTVTNTGVTMGNLVMTGNTLNMSSTSPNAIYSGDNLLISASATTSKNIYMSVAGTALQLDQYGLALGSSAKTFYCNNYEGLSALGFNMLGGNDSTFKINNTLNGSSQPVGFYFQTMYGSYPSYTTNALISGLGIGANTLYSFASNPLTLNVTTATNLINFNFNGTTRMCATNYGLWLPGDGSRSIYMTDTAPYGATTGYGRFFGLGSTATIYQDFYNKFLWRTTDLAGSTISEIMYLRNSGLNINKSSNSHSTLTNYELVLGDNIAPSGSNYYSAKMLIRGSGLNAALSPSIDFTSYYSHTSIQGSIALYDDNNYGGIFAFIVKPNGAGAGGGSQSVMEIRATNTNVGRITFPTTYYVDLYVTGSQIGGLANPTYDIPLKITASYNVTTGAYWFYGGGTSWGVVTFSSGAPQPMSILAYGTISSNYGFSIASDIRIKKDIQPAEQGALQVIDKIPIKSYDLIDNYRDGLKTSFNVIAQELLQVYPEAVSKGVSFIPNIYIKCKWIIVSETELEIYIEKSHELVVGDEIEIILEDNSIKECDVTAIIDEKTFRVNKWDAFKLEITDECFIYGKKVKDFLRIDKTKVAMLGLAGTKELYQLVKSQQKQIEKQEETIKTLLDHVTRLTEQVNQITLKMV